MKKILELKSDGTLIARIKITNDTMEIYPVHTIDNLNVMVRGNGFDYDSDEQLRAKKK